MIFARYRMWIRSALTLGIFFVAHAHAEAPLPQKHKFHLNEKAENEIGYAQAVRVGDVVYVSGSVGAGPMPQAIRQAYDELKKTLEAYGLTFRNVVKENVFSTKLDDFIQHKDLRRVYYGEDFPAATWVQVDRLYVPELVLEVEVTAAVGVPAPKASTEKP
ncbi:MAG TPA: RidA family protein [Steroidobacteraceae bacterium]|nr:RidA family protein [Steroidobacteraceae bacterium]